MFSLEVELLTSLTNLPPLLFEFDQRFSDQHMLLAHDLYVHPSLLSSIQVTNVTSRPRRIQVGTTVGYLHPSVQVYEIIETNTEESIPDALFPPQRNPVMSADQLSQININPDLTDDQRQRISKLLMGYSDVFSWDDTHRAYQGPMPAGLKLADVGDAAPIVKPYPRSFAEQQFIDEQVQLLLDRKIIRPGCSPWAAPVVLVKKPDGSWRFCVAYMKINALAKTDRFPMSSMGDLFQTLHGAKWFSSVDIRDGFFSVPLKIRKSTLVFVQRPANMNLNLYQWELKIVPAFFFVFSIMSSRTWPSVNSATSSYTLTTLALSRNI